MRIVSGLYRGRVLSGFKGDAIRPTADNVREALFNILQTKIYGSNFLDLYCGTGAVGIEALSRGASKVYFNDSNRESVALAKKNLQSLKIADGINISNLDAERFLLSNSTKFDFIFLDPPYKDGISERVQALLADALSVDGMVIYENETPFDGQIAGLVVCDKRKYGRVHLTFFKKEITE